MGIDERIGILCFCEVRGKFSFVGFCMDGNMRDLCVWILSF